MIKYQLIDNESAIHHEKKIKYLIKQLFENDKKDCDFGVIDKMYTSMKQYLKEQSAIIYGAFDKKNLVGFIWAYQRVVDNEKRYHVNYFVVENEWRKKGIGSNLIKKIKELAKIKGINTIELMVHENNNIAINFYKSFEFKVEKYLMIKRITKNKKE